MKDSKNDNSFPQSLNWEVIHKDFGGDDGKLWRGYWEDNGFDYCQTKAWIGIVLEPKYSVFAWWLVNEKNKSPEQCLNIDELKEEYDKWKQEWWGIHQEFEPATMMGWKKKGFDTQETKQWIDAGLETNDYEVADYAKNKDYNFSTINIEELRKEWRQAQIWLDWKYPKEERININKLDIRSKDLEGSLNLEGFVDLEELDCSQNELINLDISDCINLRKLKCFENQIISLSIDNLTKLQELNCGKNRLTKFSLNNFSDIRELYCYNNQLTNFYFLNDLDSKNNEKLEILYLSDNNFSASDLTSFGRFVNLKRLYLGNNFFLFGSLEPLKYLTKLERLDISNTDIDSGLEYLSESVQYFNCSTNYQLESKVKIIEEELAPYADNSEVGKYDFPKWRDENVVKMVPTLPPSLSSEKGNKLEESHEIKKKYYNNEIYPQSALPQKVDENKALSPKELPTKLYNIGNNKLTKEKKDIKNYAILSYVWGDANDPDNKLKKEEELELDKVWIKKDDEVEYKNKVNRLGYKSWQKAIETCRHPSLNINYLWIDQLCINQSDNQEKEQEVPKMGQYYSNAAVTLIGIQTEAREDKEELDLLDILKKITCSEWFARSWTFQEGWLSKWTLFMFDDILIDGRQMAALWVFQQPAHIGIKFSKEEEGSKKVATPIGWAYYKKGYKPEDKVSLRLHEALREIKNRGRGNPVDGIYSILGLLPYGNKVEVEYKKNICKDCKLQEMEQKKTIDCEHSEEQRTEWPTYFPEELERRLLHIMKVALQNGYGEPLSWHGLSNGWLPQINDKGSTTIEGGIKIDYVSQKDENIFQSDGSLKITGSEYVITKSVSDMSRWDQSSSIESGARERKIEIEIKSQKKEIELSGTKTILSSMNKLIKENNYIHLLIPNKYQWRSNKPFAILIKSEVNKNYWLGLVEISEGSEKLEGVEEKEIVIMMNHLAKVEQSEQRLKSLDRQIEEKRSELKRIQKELNELKKEKERLQSQIQIPPKGNN